ncbi:hypothetical protein TWF281_010456 [Arthrobotrys megalospora]
MNVFSLDLIILLLSSLLLIIPETLCLPTSQLTDVQGTTAASPNLALEVRASLEKRDSWNCDGSFNCYTIDQLACLLALHQFAVDPNRVYTTQQKYSIRNTLTGSCLAMYTCGKKEDYASAAQWGISKGSNLKDK